MKNFLLLALLVLTALTSNAASGFSYVYIQGDKQTPFYVKLEEGMQPRFGKNYCILSRLAPGPAHIEILFQQNAFPPQQFTIQVPDRGSREFMIVKKEGVFNLYDLQQNFYLPAGNRIDDDRAPAGAVAVAAAPKPVIVPIDPAQPATVARTNSSVGKTGPGSINTGIRSAGKAIAKGRDKSAEFAKKAVQPLRPATASEPQQAERRNSDGTPSFIGGMELSTPNTDPSIATTASATAGTSRPVPQPVIRNSDCPAPMDASEFGKVFNGLSSYSTDEERLEYFGKQLDKCYETWHARTLAGKVEGDAAKFELLRKIYPRISDQGAFPLLDDVLSAPAWKEAFNRLVNR